MAIVRAFRHHLRLGNRGKLLSPAKEIVHDAESVAIRHMEEGVSAALVVIKEQEDPLRNRGKLLGPAKEIVHHVLQVMRMQVGVGPGDEAGGVVFPDILPKAVQPALQRHRAARGCERAPDESHCPARPSQVEGQLRMGVVGSTRDSFGSGKVV
jgi:hypothetical protein